MTEPLAHSPDDTRAPEPTLTTRQHAFNSAAPDQLDYRAGLGERIPKIGFSREEAAEALGISTQSIDRLVERGLLRPSRALRRPIFSRAELERFLNQTK